MDLEQIKQAVRAFRRAMHANREWFEAAQEFAAADAMFDAGEFGGGDATAEQMDEREHEILFRIAARFDLDTATLYDAVVEADAEQQGCLECARQHRWEREQAIAPRPTWNGRRLPALLRPQAG